MLKSQYVVSLVQISKFNRFVCFHNRTVFTNSVFAYMMNFLMRSPHVVYRVGKRPAKMVDQSEFTI